MPNQASRNLADKVFSEYIRYRDRGCVRCFTDRNLECAHILPRHYLIVRCDPDNAYCLCHSCHVWYTGHPNDWKKFVEFRHPGRFALLLERAQSMVTPDWTEVVKDLRRLHEELKERREQPGNLRGYG